MTTPIISLPAGLHVSQASFGRSHSERVETRARSGIEDRFRNGADRWIASFIAAPHARDRDALRAFLVDLGETGALVYVHDINAAKPTTPVRTAEGFDALDFTIVDENDAPVSLVSGDGSPVTAVHEIAPLGVAVDAIAGASEVVISGLWPLSTALSAGAYIQIGHWLYLARAPITAALDGTATVSIRPTLWRDALASTTVRFEQAATVMRLDQRTTRWTGTVRDRRHAVAFQFVEALPQEGVPD